MNPGLRHERLDALRGLAVAWMVGFHLCFDLNHFGWWVPRQHFLSDPFWTWQRAAIVTMFLFCTGMGQALAIQAGQSWARFGRRWCQVAGCALLVSAGSALMFPRSWISFGVLHGVAVMWWLVRVSVPVMSARRQGDDPRLQGLLWGAGALALVAPRLVGFESLNGRWGHWLGLVTRLPVTEDYVPVLPWLGVVLWGVAVASWLSVRRPHWLQAPVGRIARPLVWLGRHSLSVYMLHQPLFFGVLMGLGAWLRA